MSGLLQLCFNCRKGTYSFALGKSRAYLWRERTQPTKASRKPLWISLLSMKDGTVGFEKIFSENSDPSVFSSLKSVITVPCWLLYPACLHVC